MVKQFLSCNCCSCVKVMHFRNGWNHSRFYILKKKKNYLLKNQILFKCFSTILNSAKENKLCTGLVITLSVHFSITKHEGWKLRAQKLNLEIPQNMSDLNYSLSSSKKEKEIQFTHTHKWNMWNSFHAPKAPTHSVKVGHCDDGDISQRGVQRSHALLLGNQTSHWPVHLHKPKVPSHHTVNRIQGYLFANYIQMCAGICLRDIPFKGTKCHGSLNDLLSEKKQPFWGQSGLLKH